MAFTVVTKHKEAAGAEVTMEFDENLIGSGGHALLDSIAAKLADLGWSLIGPVPAELKKVGIWKKERIMFESTSNNLETNEPYLLV